MLGWLADRVLQVRKQKGGGEGHWDWSAVRLSDRMLQVDIRKGKEGKS